MPRPLRLQYEGAIYHVMSRGDRREAIFCDDRDRAEFLRALGQTCGKTGWQVHAYCLMTNHFHLVVETPQPNLAAGMKWFLGTYTQRFNRRHRQWGHLFGGRYKAQSIDGRGSDYLRVACDYVHLNPVRAGLVGKKKKLESFPWSSYPAYRRPKGRPSWVRVDRLLGEHGLEEGKSAAARREFERRMRHLRVEPQGNDAILRRSGWKIGAEDFADWLTDKLGRPASATKKRREHRETDAARAEKMVLEALTIVRWREIDLASRAKRDPVKVKIARRLRAETPMSRKWIAARLKMGSASYLAALVRSDDSTH